MEAFLFDFLGMYTSLVLDSFNSVFDLAFLYWMVFFVIDSICGRIGFLINAEGLLIYNENDLVDEMMRC